MPKSPFQTAQQQLLSHLRRSGIRYFPKADEESVKRAAQWMSDNFTPSPNASTAPSDSPKASATAPSPAQLPPKSTAAETTFASSARTAVPTHVSNIVPNTPATTVSTSRTPSEPSSSPRSKPVVPQTLLGSPGEWLTAPKSESQRQAEFQQIDALVKACTKCTDIVCRRQQTVFGVGPVQAKLVMFGEAPGADEDRAGEPFVGAAGQLMNKILIASGLSREQVYIMNSLKCRPPNNRTPIESEIENCRPFFEAQLEVIQPDYIICWGSVAVRAILKTSESVGRLRGRFHAYRGAKVLVTYHPAYLLRTPDAKRHTWDDMKMLMAELGIPIPTPKR